MHLNPTLLTAALLICGTAFCQDDIHCTTLRLTPEGKDAYTDMRVHDFNYGDHIDIASIAWTNGGTPTACRSYFAFDLSSIPTTEPIVSAALTLHAYNSPANGSHSTLSGDNTSYIRRVTADWDEHTITWDNQPPSTTADQRTIPSTNVMTDITGLDVTPLVSEMLTSGNYGFVLLLDNEDYYRRQIYASGDNPSALLRPTLEVCYKTQPAGIHMPDDISGIFTLFPNPSEGIFHLQHSGAPTEYAYTVTSASGQIIRTLTSAEELVTVDLSEEEAGVYFVQITGANGTAVKQLLVR